MGEQSWMEVHGADHFAEKRPSAAWCCQSMVVKAMLHALLVRSALTYCA